ncbi:MAG: Sec-independent protein translocase protein TatB [Gallionella sp.]
MFEFSFSELMVVMVVALVVIGPERLPKVARTLGLLWGRAQRYVHGVRADIERDLAVAEFQQLKAKVQAEADAAQQAVQLLDKNLAAQAQQLNQGIAALEQPISPSPKLPSE